MDDILGPLLEADAAHPSHETIQAVSDAIANTPGRAKEFLGDRRLVAWICAQRHRINEWGRARRGENHGT